MSLYFKAHSFEIDPRPDGSAAISFRTDKGTVTVDCNHDVMFALRILATGATIASAIKVASGGEGVDPLITAVSGARTMAALKKTAGAVILNELNNAAKRKKPGT